MKSRIQCGSAGLRFRRALNQERPLQIAGVINAYAAIMAERVGFRALYLSGAGVANAAHGIPDLGLTTRADVLEEVRRITTVSRLPLLVDADTGFGTASEIARTVREMIAGGAAGIHLEDQLAAKRCGHRPNKVLVTTDEMVARLRAAIRGRRRDSSFVIMARTDAAAVEGLEAAIGRARRYRDAGADMIFAEALTSLDQYRRFATEVAVPILANMTEFGVTPLFNRDELAAAGVRLALYPLSAFRAMNAAALRVYRAIRDEGSQRSVVDSMQTRQDLYAFLDYERHERRVDQALQRKRRSRGD